MYKQVAIYPIGLALHEDLTTPQQESHGKEGL